MEIKITYPNIKRKRKFLEILDFILTVLLIASIFILPLINIAVGGKAWSAIAVFSIYIFWSGFVYPTIYELNRTTHFIKLYTLVIILLILINALLDTGATWGILVLPIVGFSGLIIAAILFFTDFENQKHHFSLFSIYIMICIVAGITGIFIDKVPPDMKWTYIVLASLGLFLFIFGIILLRKTIILDIKKKWAIK